MSQNRRSFRLAAPCGQWEAVEDLLRVQGYDLEPDSFFGPARRLLREPKPLGNSLAAFFGRIYIQDRASMLPPLALNPPEGVAVLDMCASPGSKTGQLAALVGPTGLVLGNEPNPSRLATLRRNMQLLDLARVVTCCHKGERLPLPAASWDFIQLDPPCSGWGTEDRHPGVRSIWKDDKIDPLVRIQRGLLREAARLLRPGGVLVYSTCTTNPRENEEQILFAREELGLASEALPALPGFRFQAGAPGGEGAWLLEPDADAQGFFVARLRKAEGPLPGDASAVPEPLRVAWAPEAALREAGVDSALLPAPIGMFGESLHMAPPQALGLPAALRWQGLYCGKSGRGGPRLSPRLRHASCLPPLDLEGAEGAALLEALVQGRSVPAPGGAEQAVMLRWKGLALGRAAVKGGRLVWSER